ncbi:MAG: PAS domain S-box protein [Acetobacteraceae bacterium]|nr:PAS domain S-box protein [Acetobacteraceae bacterium]
MLRAAERQFGADGVALHLLWREEVREASRGVAAAAARTLAAGATPAERLLVETADGRFQAVADATVGSCRACMAVVGTGAGFGADEGEALLDLAALAAAAMAIPEGPGTERLRIALVERLTEPGDVSASLSALAESEAGFRALFRRNPVPMCIHSADTLRPLRINVAMATHYGWSWDRLRQMSLLDILDPEDRPAARGGWGSQPGRQPWRLRRPDGELRLVQVSADALRFEGQDAVLAAFWDVTERWRAEEELRHSRASLLRQARTLRHAQLLARLGSWRLALGADCFEWDEDAHRVFGTDPARFVPRVEAVLELLQPEDRVAFAAALREGSRLDLTVRLRDAQGRERWCHIEAGRDEDWEQPGLLGYVQDVTEQRDAETALLRAEKMRSIGQLTGGVAHDFNNLLTVTGVNLEIAEDRLSRGEEAEDVIVAARQAVQRGARLTRQLLSYARRQSHQAETLSLGEFLAPLIELLRRTLGERYAVTLDIGAGTPAVRAEPAQLEAALLNLCLNAQDAMPEGGEIRIRTAPEPPAQPGLAEAQAVIEVTDTGTGMPAEVRDRIFEPFYTTKGQGHGTGLGLSMVQGFVQRAGGRVTVESTPGQGTTFRLYLPAAEPEPVAPPCGDAPPAPLPRAEILVVENDDDVRTAVVRLCQELGLEVWSTRRPQEALAMLRAGFRFDLLFTDLVLSGGLDGPELAREAQRTQPDIAVLFTSGYPQGEAGVGSGPAAWRAEELAAELLPKPFDQASFRAALARALAGREDGSERR